MTDFDGFSNEKKMLQAKRLAAAVDPPTTTQNLVLWCVHVLGPDDVHAAASFREAAWSAAGANISFAEIEQPADPVLCFAYAAPWPYSDEMHAEDLKNRRSGANVDVLAGEAAAAS